MSNTISESKQITYLKDYQKPTYNISNIDLEFDIFDDHTIVKSHLIVSSINSAVTASEDLILNGEALELVSVNLNQTPLNAADYVLTDTHLIIPSLLLSSSENTLTITTKLYPHLNKALEGLYVSDNIFCTQNEAEGFRRITYFLDRPDCMSLFKTTIKADKTKCPILLSNGNCIDKGDLENNRHFAVWEDPFLKPCYLYALVAGDLAKVEDAFVTQSGRKVSLEIYVDHGNEGRCDHAMRSLKNSMKWDEETYNLEYDLDIFMIVAVDAFNMGAMENKGLNIFNSAYVLASPETATDNDYRGIESVIAHEYFHNWTGNRVTCRDWFQLTLKEGLTVFRDQEFSSDMHSRAVQRITDVRALRSRQFAEDASPMTHPIRPESYMEIDNFYTATIYEKGAEVIRMIQTLIGHEAWFNGIKIYFDNFDGMAVTTDDFIWAMEQSSGRDLNDFKLWYSQAGTPECTIQSDYNAETQQLTISISQSCRETSETPSKLPFLIPIRLGLLSASGEELSFQLNGKDETGTVLIELSETEQTLVLDAVETDPIISALRGFSAPVKLTIQQSIQSLAVLFQHDTDLFNRYEAGQKLASQVLVELMTEFRQDHPIQNDILYPPVLTWAPKSKATISSLNQFMTSFNTVLLESSDPSFVALAITLPGISRLVDDMTECDFQGAIAAREYLKRYIATEFSTDFNAKYQELSLDINTALSAGKPQSATDVMAMRDLKSLCLSYLSVLDASLAETQFKTALTMTDQLAALGYLCQKNTTEKADAVAAFYDKYKNESLLMNKWLSIQTSSMDTDIMDVMASLESHSIFDKQNPNKIRALYGAFSQNALFFHDVSGKGYDYMAKKVMEVDAFNPSIAARLVSVFKKYPVMDAGRKSKMKVALDHIIGNENCSKNVFELADKIRNS